MKSLHQRLKHRINQRAVRTSLLASQRGMTLVEIMIVLTIMASVMTVVGFFAVGALQNAKVKKAQTEVAQIANFIESYYAFQEEFPSSLEDLVNPPGGMAPITREIPLDPWRNDYEFNRTGNDSYELFSAGPDGQTGSDDDIFAPGTGGNS